MVETPAVRVDWTWVLVAAAWRKVRSRTDTPVEAAWETWTRDDVAVWLLSRGIPSTSVRKLSNVGVNGDYLPHLTEDEMVGDFGLPRPAARTVLKLVTALLALTATAAASK